MSRSNKVSHQQKLQWKKLVSECEASDKSIASWCREKGVRYHRLLYWRDRFQKDSQPVENPCTRDSFIEVPSGSQSKQGIRIYQREIEIHLPDECEESALKAIIQTLRREAC